MWSSPAASIAPRVPRGHDGVGLAGADGTARGDQARVRLRAHRVGRLLVHADLLGRLDELEALRVEVGGPEEDDVDAVARRLERARDHLAGPAVAAQGVDRYPRHYGAVRRQRLDVAAPVRLAVRADVMRPLRPVADRALVHARRLQAMRRPALVAA